MAKKTIYGNPPSKSNGYKIITISGHGSLAKTRVLKEYESNFYIQCTERNRALEGFFELHMDVYFQSQRNDIDGCLKIILDCMQKCNVFKNDNKCTHLNIRKFKDEASPRIEYEIIPVT